MSLQVMPPTDKVRLRWPARYTAGQHPVTVEQRVLSWPNRGRLSRPVTTRERIAARRKYGKRIKLA